MNRQVCPKDCPRRSISPNCHNEETCEHWKRHMETVRKEEAERRERGRAARDYRETRRIKQREIIRECERKRRGE